MGWLRGLALEPGFNSHSAAFFHVALGKLLNIFVVESPNILLPPFHRNGVFSWAHDLPDKDYMWL
jgi:hypothetical protein